MDHVFFLIMGNRPAALVLLCQGHFLSITVWITVLPWWHFLSSSPRYLKSLGQAEAVGQQLQQQAYWMIWFGPDARIALNRDTNGINSNSLQSIQPNKSISTF